MSCIVNPLQLSRGIEEADLASYIESILGETSQEIFHHRADMCHWRHRGSLLSEDQPYTKEH